MPDAKRLSDEDIALLRELPEWEGLSTTGCLATELTDVLTRAGLTAGSLTDDPFDLEDGHEPRVWRNTAGDALLATLDHHIEKTRREVLAEVDEAAGKLGAVQGVPYAPGVFPEGSWAVSDSVGDDYPRRDAEAATFTEALFAAANPPASPPIEGGE